MATGQNILFTVRFNVTGGAESYRSFIRDIRQRVASHRFARQVRMLNSEKENRNNWFDIELIADNSQITLRMRYGDLYFIGFQVPSGQWYEFNDRNHPIFPQAQLLRFKSDYPSDNTTLAATEVGQNYLTGAVTSLANYKPRNTDNRQLLICLMIMFPEAFRFTTIEQFVYERFRQKTDAPIGTQNVELIKNWGSLSWEMRVADRFSSFNELRFTGITSDGQAAKILALGLWSDKAFNSQCDVSIHQYGKQLAEIFWVQMLNIDKDNPGDLYGKIDVIDGLATPQCIFSRSEDNKLNIRSKEFIPLEGPTRAISAFDSFCIDVSLKSQQKEMIREQIGWNYFSDNLYNQPISTEVKGKYGSVAICYAVYCNAVLATVQVKLINGDNKKVYGTLDASNTLNNQPITLFNNKGNDVNVIPQDVILLQRSMVVVPLAYSLKITADLRDTLSPDYSIAQGSVTFPAAAAGNNSGIISGKDGAVEVTVTWSSA